MVATLKPFGLTHVQFVLLASAWWLETTGEPPSQRELAEHAGTDPMMTSQVVRTLERDGRLWRAPDAHDARVRRLALTDAGRALLEEALPAVEAADAAFFSQAGERSAVVSMLLVLAGREEPPAS